MSTTAAARRPDRRDDARTRLSLAARLLSGGKEQAGTLTDFSLGGMAIQSKPRLPLGAEVVAYVDRLARIEGRVARYIPGGFVVAFELTEAKERRLGAALDRMSASHDADDAPAPAPSVPPHRIKSVRLDDGGCIDCEVADASILGITCESDHRPALGTHVVIGGADARVVRHLAHGFRVEFDRYWASVSPWTGRK